MDYLLHEFIKQDNKSSIKSYGKNDVSIHLKKRYKTTGSLKNIPTQLKRKTTYQQNQIIF